MNPPIDNVQLTSLLVDMNINGPEAQNAGGKDNTAALPFGNMRSLQDQAARATEDLLSTLKANAVIQSDATAAQANVAEIKDFDLLGAEQVKFAKRFALDKLLLQVKNLITNINLSNLYENLQRALQKSMAFMQSNTALAADFQKALDASEAAIGVAETDQLALQEADNNLAEKQRLLDQAKAALSQMQPEDEGYAAAQRAVTDAQSGVNEAKTRFDNALAKAQDSYQVAWDSIIKLDDLYTKSSPSSISAMDDERVLNAMTRLLKMMLAFNTMLVDKNLHTITEEANKLQQMRRDQQVHLTQKADEHAAQMKKSEALNTAMGCLGKILGGLIALVSVVGALFTGGASLALAAVGIALMAGDMIGKAITGVSFLEKAISPLMEHVINPLINAIGSAIAKMLEGMGVNSDIAATVGAIVGALATVALIIAAMLVGKSSAASAVGNMLGNIVKKLVPDVLKNVASQAGGFVTKTISRVLEKMGRSTDRAAMQQRANLLSRLENGLTLVNQGSQSVGMAAQGALQYVIKTLKAYIDLALASSQQIKALIEKLIDSFNEKEPLAQQVLTDLAKVMDNKAATFAGIFMSGKSA